MFIQKRTYKPYIASFLLTSILLLAISSQANAVPITFNFGGTVGIPNAPLSGIFNSTQTISGSYTFESSTPDTSPSYLPNRGIYDGTLIDLTFTIGSNTWTMTNPSIDNFIFLDNEANYDRYQLTVKNGNLTGPSVGTMTPDTFIIVLDDLTHTVFDNTSLLTTAPNLSNFSIALWHFAFDDGTTSPPGVSGQISSFTSVAEPATLTLLGLGLAGIGFLRRMTV